MTVDDLADVMLKLIELAKAGEGWAVKELFDRALGRPVQPAEVNVAGVVNWEHLVRRLEGEGAAFPSDDPQGGRE